jgi:hypothetical protein
VATASLESDASELKQFVRANASLKSEASGLSQTSDAKGGHELPEKIMGCGFPSVNCCFLQRLGETRPDGAFWPGRGGLGRPRRWPKSASWTFG